MPINCPQRKFEEAIADFNEQLKKLAQTADIVTLRAFSVAESNCSTADVFLKGSRAEKALNLCRGALAMVQDDKPGRASEMLVELERVLSGVLEIK